MSQPIPEPSYLGDLNDRQREAAQATEGPLLILAGAGAGKTKTLTYRILHLIRKGVSPRAILAITFTNKAAREMRDRVHALLSADPAGSLAARDGLPFVSTFHSLGVHLIREEFAAAGVSKRFTILDRSESKSAVRGAMADLGYDPKAHDPAKILAAISRAKGDMLNPDSYAEAERGKSRLAPVVVPIWRRYEEILVKQKALDFDDLLFRAVHLLEKDSELRARWQSRWQYVHVDEYQDTNEVQYRLTKILAAKHRNLAVVGDADQNIYSWRGATIKNILHFERDYPEVKMVLLEQNYRSTQTILAAANAVICKNENRHDKRLFTENGAGEKIVSYGAGDEADEARWIAESCAELVAAGTPASEIAVLYRANFLSRAIEEAMLRQGVAYRVLGTRFFERREVKDLLSWISAAVSPDDLASFRRASASPARGIGKVTLLAALEGREAALAAGGRQKIADFRHALEEIAAVAARGRTSETVKFALSRSGLEASIKAEGPEGEERLENVRELVSLATKYDSVPPEEALQKLLDDAALASDADELESAPDGVRLMTVHASKGLEFDRVFVAGLEQGLFPHEGFGEARDGEEERRLFYVALTRARRRLYLSHAAVRTVFGSRQVSLPSEFLGDIAPELVEDTGATDSGVSSGIKSYFIDF
ncbi:MAG TPA: UvrD-helicase domain-containing protein [Candidatus Paceibacterota bacterium]